MADYTEQKTSAQVEREVDLQRARVESTIGDIQEKLTPGNMVDELLNYAKNSGGGDFVANLGKSVSTNPLPVALIGISLLWLMAKPNNGVGKQSPASDQRTSYSEDPNPTGDDYGYATVAAPLRLAYSTDHTGARYGEFVDQAGKKFRALTDAAGNRAGHFSDEAGNTFRGFRDAAGGKVDDFRDEAGSAIDTATNWASDTWQKVGDAARETGANLSDRRDQLQQRASEAGGMVQQQADQVSKTLLGVLHDQPLVAGALAFAVGAAVASAFPHTKQEDQAFGAASDKLKHQAGDAASDAYDKGKAQVTDVFEQVSDKAAEVYQQAKDGIANAGNDSDAKPA
jgi:hypothetical protein